MHPIVPENSQTHSPATDRFDGRSRAQWLVRSSIRSAASWWMGLQNLPQKNRDSLYGGHHGLRIATFHDTPHASLGRFQKIVNACRRRWEMAAPSDVESYSRLPDGIQGASADRLLLTFDDGFESNFAAAKWLGEQGIQAMFFIVPEFVGKSVDEMQAALGKRGIIAKPINADGSRRGLTRSQLNEMQSMGHRIAAHNTCHRDLGKLQTDEDLAIEIDESLDKISEWTGETCRDYAYAWGREKNLTTASAERLKQRDCRIYASIRGLNVRGLTGPILWRNAIQSSEPVPFILAGIGGGMDHRLAGSRHQVNSLMLQG